MDKNRDDYINPNEIPSPEIRQPSHRWSHLKQFARKIADASRIPNIQLKIVFITHVFLASLAGMGTWAAASSYLFYNVILVLTLMWGIHKHTNHEGRVHDTNIEEPLLLAIILNGVYIFMDIVLISVRFNDSRHTPTEDFFAAIVIIHLLVRPVTMLILYQLWKQQLQSQVNQQNLPASKPYAYEDMDKPITPAYSHLYPAGFDFSSAQQL